jgi:hypothetical protein
MHLCTIVGVLGTLLRIYSKRMVSRIILIFSRRQLDSLRIGTSEGS